MKDLFTYRKKQCIKIKDNDNKSTENWESIKKTVNAQNKIFQFNSNKIVGF